MRIAGDASDEDQEEIRAQGEKRNKNAGPDLGGHAVPDANLRTRLKARSGVYWVTRTAAMATLGSV